ncbi:glycine-rich domain-containing protein [Flavobacterium sp. KACC 22763]|uniref:glycine-rich domain-containing protein n=1 Tax=Flavobacterium sp. KACC 22763 TaxID=3025668 RepID=UPI00236562FA|nr:T9SS sorting signal type C domain-containing protein [Flavobacterium sp. KACC 22763]WDF63318.1 T9SS sorting signal type C domain-containing protein [Flavobacterium sp. KACC 22763]
MMRKLLYSFLFFIFLHSAGFGQTSTTITLNAGQTSFTVPCSVTSITVECWGAGGAGGGTTANNAGGGGGGAGGAYAKSTFSVSPNQVFNCSIAAATAGSTNPSRGASGDDTWFSSATVLIAKGGQGGLNPNGGTVLGGVGTAVGSMGDSTSQGANGNVGNTSQGGAGGNGGGTGGGTGGASRSNAGNGGDGNSGNAPGGGGGGSYVGNNSNRAGGSGGAGQIKITYNIPATIVPTNSVGGPYTFCTGSTTTYTTGNVIAGQYALVNVIKGFKYTFSVQNAFASLDENLTILDAATDANVSPATSASGVSGATITDWIPSVSGQVKVVLSAAGCAANGTVGSRGITVTQTAIGNSQDNQNDYGTNNWVAHVYTAGGKEPITFTSDKYLGYYNVSSESINENFGAGYTCFSFMSGGATRGQVYTQGFAVRHRMKTTKSGCYMITVSGDDGVRLYLNGTNILDRWVEQASTTYTNVVVNLDGDDDLVFDYYENDDANSVTFTMAPFDTNSNTITAPATVDYCGTGTYTPGQIVGSLQYSSGDPNLQNPQLSFQWQSSTDGVAFNNINTAGTSRNYSPPSITANNVVYYRRLVSISGSSGCSYAPSNIVRISASSATPPQPGVITQPANICAGSTTSTFSVAPVARAVFYTWSVTGTGWSVASGGNTASATIAIGSGQGTVSVTATNACGTSPARTTSALNPTTAPSQPGAITQPTNLCAGSTNNAFSISPVSGATSYAWSVTGTGWSVTGGANTASASITIGSGQGTVSVIAINGCGNSIARTTSALNPTTAPFQPGAITPPTNLCAGSTNNTFSIATVSGATSYTWSVTGTGWLVTAGGNTASASITIGSGQGTVSVTATNACGTSIAQTTGTLTPTTVPPQPGAITPPVNLCAGSSNNTFSISPISGATSYAWSVTGTGWSVTGGANTASSTITVGSGQGTVSVTATNACGTSTAQTTGTLTPTTNTITLSSVVGTDSQTICANTAISDIKYTTTGATGATFSGLPNGVTGGWSGNVVTISGTPTTEVGSPFNYTVTLTNGCGNISTTGTIAVKQAPTAPSITKNNDVSCGSFGSITLTGLSGNWTINQTGTTTLARSFSGTSSTLPIQDLIVGTYYFTVTNDLNCTSSSATVTINDISSNTTWNGSGWSNGEPDGSKSVTISSVVPNQPFSAAKPNITACSLNINVPNGATDPNVIIPSEMTLTITNGISSNGKLIFESGSSLLQGANAVNTGSISYKRKVSMRRYDVVYWSSPVNGLSMHDFSPNTLFDKYHYWNSATSKWVLNKNGTRIMEEGQGYSIRAPQYFDLVSPSVFDGTFVGTPNNGDWSVPVEHDKLNLVGNPYPSPINAAKLMLENKDHIGSLYFWTHNQPPQLEQGTNTFKYLSSDFVIYNGTGSVRVSGEIVSGADEFDGFIGAGQAFFTNAPPTATVIKFNNGLREGSSKNTQFYKTDKTSEVEKNRLWLNIANSQGAFKQILIGYIEGATNSNDALYDATTMGSNSYIDFYSINESKNLIVQGRALPFDNTEVIPLGYRSGVDDKGDRNFTISIDHADGFFATQDVYLEDKTTGKIIDLRKENYTFFSAGETNTTRFSLRYTNKTLGTGEFENLENTVLVSVKDKTVNIASSKETIKEVNVYNIGAQLLYTNSKVNASELQIKNLHSTDQVLLVKITLENGHTFTKKAIFSNL